jgi:uncharacterized membrane protein (DUF4010 family)
MTSDSIWTWTMPLGGFVVSFGIGMLIGVDRERRKESGAGRDAAGVRTFALVALLGTTVASFESVLLVAVFGAAIALLAGAAYLKSVDDDTGITTTVALVVVYVLGALAVRKPEFAAGIGVLVALLLASRSRLHEFARQRLTDQEVLDAILLAAAALIVLPLLPNRAIDQFGVVNPQVIWRLTVAVLLVNAFGYVAIRALGAGTGLPVAGFFGGFISSVVTIGTLGRRARADPGVLAPAIAGAALSSVATVLQLALVLAIANRDLLIRLSVALGAMAVVAAAYGGVFAYVAVRGVQPTQATAGRAFQPRYAIVFALTVTAFLLVCALLADRYGAYGATFGIALAGFADVHSASASAARLQASGILDESQATTALLLAVAANCATKGVVAWTAGGWRYLRAVGPGILLMLATFVLTAGLHTHT